LGGLDMEKRAFPIILRRGALLKSGGKTAALDTGTR